MLKEIFAFLGFTSPFFFLYIKGKKKPHFQNGIYGPQKHLGSLCLCCEPPVLVPPFLAGGKVTEKEERGKKRAWPQVLEHPQTHRAAAGLGHAGGA